MKKLIKPTLSVEDFSEEMVQAFCEHDGCTPNCKEDCHSISFQDCNRHSPVKGCKDVRGISIDEDILF